MDSKKDNKKPEVFKIGERCFRCGSPIFTIMFPPAGTPGSTDGHRHTIGVGCCGSCGNYLLELSPALKDALRAHSEFGRCHDCLNLERCQNCRVMRFFFPIDEDK